MLLEEKIQQLNKYNSELNKYNSDQKQELHKCDSIITKLNAQMYILFIKSSQQDQIEIDQLKSMIEEQRRPRQDFSLLPNEIQKLKRTIDSQIESVEIGRTQKMEMRIKLLEHDNVQLKSRIQEREEKITRGAR